MLELGIKASRKKIELKFELAGEETKLKIRSKEKFQIPESGDFTIAGTTIKQNFDIKGSVNTSRLKSSVLVRGNLFANLTYSMPWGNKFLATKGIVILNLTTLTTGGRPGKRGERIELLSTHSHSSFRQ